MQGITARVRYAKTGLARFIGHLDTARALLRAVRRAGVETLYTQGFTPRMRLSFGPPLPLGLSSDCEYMDIKLARGYDPETVKEKFQSQLPEGLAVTEVEVLGDAPEALQTAFWATEYEIGLPGGGVPARVRAQAWDAAQHTMRASARRPGERPGEGWIEPRRTQRGESGAPEQPTLADAPPETPPAAGHAENAPSCVVPGQTGEESPVVDLSWREETTPGRAERVLSVIVRHDVPGGGRVKEVVRRLLGIEEPELERLRIHKKNVFWRGERPLTSLPGTQSNRRCTQMDADPASA